MRKGVNVHSVTSSHNPQLSYHPAMASTFTVPPSTTISTAPLPSSVPVPMTVKSKTAAVPSLSSSFHSSTTNNSDNSNDATATLNSCNDHDHISKDACTSISAPAPMLTKLYQHQLENQDANMIVIAEKYGKENHDQHVDIGASVDDNNIDFDCEYHEFSSSGR